MVKTQAKLPLSVSQESFLRYVCIIKLLIVCFRTSQLVRENVQLKIWFAKKIGAIVWIVQITLPQ